MLSSAARQVLNSGSKDLQLLKVFSCPPIALSELDSWQVDGTKAIDLASGPFDRKCLPGSFFGGRFANKPDDNLM